MYRKIVAISGLGLAALLAACGGTGPGSSGLPIGSIRPLPSLPIPSFAIPSFDLGSFSIPSFAIPSFASDPAIEAAIPREIGGSQVENISSSSFLAFLQAFDEDGQTTTQFVQGMQSAGIDPASVGIGSASVTLDGDRVDFQVGRFPGGNAAKALDVLVRLDQPDEQPNLTQQTIGGKNVTVSTLSDGDVEYFYINGEWAWFVSDATPEQAETIIAALP